MHPNAYLKTFWLMDSKPEVFVAMSFAPKFRERYTRVITPAIQEQGLRAFRVDISQSGDSILTDIVDGIAHSQMVLADVSTIGHDGETEQAYRNGNVMYEVGIALACRQPADVLLIRDDDDRFLFDVSTIPHLKIDFTNIDGARRQLSQVIELRLREQRRLNDVRVDIAVAALTAEEIAQLKTVANRGPEHVWSKQNNPYTFSVLARLADKQIIRMVAEVPEDSRAAYQLTEIGWEVAKRATKLPHGTITLPDESSESSA